MSYDRDEEIYGSELIADVKRWQQEGNKEVVTRVQQLEQQLQQNTVEACQERCMRALDADPQLANRWRQINDDPAFIKWLNTVDELHGIPRMKILSEIYNRGYAPGVVNMFKAYLASLIPARQRTNERLPMENQTAGRRPSVSVADVDGRQKKIWTGQEIRQFYLDRSKGLFDGREGESARIEQDIFNAQKERRIAPGSVQPHMPNRQPWE